MASLKSLNEIFTNTLFRIPDYQRGYAWIPDQLKDFWDDLYNLDESKHHYTGVLTIKEVPAEISGSVKWNEEHWVLKERGYRAFYVVDGQQRLTTSIIFMQALVEVIKAFPDNKGLADSEIYIGSFSVKDIKENYLVAMKPPHNIVKTYKFGYESDNPSFKFLRHRIFNEDDSGTVDETFYTLNLENAKRFFLEKIKAVQSNEGEEGLVGLFKKLTVNFKFNLYEIEEDFDVFVAFETMNNRGKKLSNLELLKNRLIYLTTLFDLEEFNEDDRISLRGKIDDAWKEVYHQLGRNKSAPLKDDEFLVAHWIMYFQYSRQKGNDYINFLLNEQFTPKNIFVKKEIPVTSLEKFEEIVDANEEDEESKTEYNLDTGGNTTIKGKGEKLKPIWNEILESIEKGQGIQNKLKPKEIESYVNSLKASAVHWYNTFNPLNNSQLTKAEQEWLDKLNRIGIAYFRPLIVASFLNDEIDSTQRVRLFKAIERFIFIAFRLGRALSSYRNSEFYKAARLLRNGEWTVEAIVQLLDKRIDYMYYHYEGKEEEFWFDYTLFKKYIDRNFRDGGGFYKWNGLRYFLYEYEMDLVKQRGSQKIDWALFIKNEGDKISIEHILPQTPDKQCWKSSLKGFSKEQKLMLQGTLGNLVPLSQSINSSLQNDCFEEKRKAKLDEKGKKTREGYNNGSHSEIEVSHNSQWTAEEILKRGIHLLNFMEKRWNLKFESEKDKIALLCLEFLTEEKGK